MVLVMSCYDILRKGEKAIDFSLKGIDGKSYSLGSFTNAKALLILFMCNHCPYVIPKMDYFVELQKKYGPEGLQIVAINPNDPTNYPSDNLEGMKKIAQEKGFNFPYLVDGSQEVAKKYGAICTPDPFLFNQKHELAYHGRVDDAHKMSHSYAKSSELEEAIKEVFTGKEVTVPTVPSMGCSIKWKISTEPSYFLKTIKEN